MNIEPRYEGQNRYRPKPAKRHWHISAWGLVFIVPMLVFVVVTALFLVL